LRNHIVLSALRRVRALVHVDASVYGAQPESCYLRGGILDLPSCSRHKDCASNHIGSAVQLRAIFGGSESGYEKGAYRNTLVN
jgi:hypothetical protein